MEKEKNFKSEAYLFAKMFFITLGIHWIILAIGYHFMGDAKAYGNNIFAAYYYHFSGVGDTVHYLRIAENWYTATGEYCNNIVFYPLYPLLMKVLGLVVRDYFIAGAIISNVCVGVAGYFMHKLAALEVGEEKAMDSFLLYIVYPFSTFTIMVYTESLSMMLVVMCLYYIKKNKWWLAGITGLLASFAKSQCIALMVPAVYEVILYMIRQKKFKFQGLFVMLIPCGTGMYLLINKVIQGDWFSFAKHQEAEPWFNVAHWISENISQHYGMAKDYFTLSLLMYMIQLILYFVVMAALFYGMKKKISTSLIAFGGAYMFLSYLHGWLISGPRYVMGCATMYIIYAAIDNKFVKYALLFLCTILSIFYTLGLWRQEAIM